jgi:hypothetical protein
VIFASQNAIYVKMNFVDIIHVALGVKAVTNGYATIVIEGVLNVMMKLAMHVKFFFRAFIVINFFYAKIVHLFVIIVRIERVLHVMNTVYIAINHSASNVNPTI